MWPKSRPCGMSSLRPPEVHKRQRRAQRDRRPGAGRGAPPHAAYRKDLAATGYEEDALGDYWDIGASGEVTLHQTAAQLNEELLAIAESGGFDDDGMPCHESPPLIARPQGGKSAHRYVALRPRHIREPAI
jgi:hypothetical protein